MIEIPLTRGYTTVVDDADADLAKHKWCAVTNPSGDVYAMGYAVAKRHKFMHRTILERILGRDLLPDEFTDHRDHNGLNNRRDNLRLATRQQNQRYQLPNNPKSGYKGVVQNNKDGFWDAAIQVDHKVVRLGHYTTAEEAGIAYNHAAKEYFGEFALFNDIPNWQDIHPVRRYYERRRDNTSGFAGVTFHKKLGRWQARLAVNGTRHHVGYFDTPEEAYTARCQAAIDLGTKWKPK